MDADARIARPVRARRGLTDSDLIRTAAELTRQVGRLTFTRLAERWGVSKSAACRAVWALRQLNRWPFPDPKLGHRLNPSLKIEVSRMQASGLTPIQAWRALRGRGQRISKAVVRRWYGPAKRPRRPEPRAVLEQQLIDACKAVKQPGRWPAKKAAARLLGWTVAQVETVNKRLRLRGVGLFRKIEKRTVVKDPTPAQIRAEAERIKREHLFGDIA